MDIVNSFKTHLQEHKSKPSKVTIKNYVSDVRKFVLWYERTYNAQFSPLAFTTEAITRFQSEIIKSTDGSLPAVRSAKRYISSLRKFARFLEDSGAIKANPFAAISQPKAPEDPWQIKAFRNSLVSQNASKLTIKNYIVDVQQFLEWLEKVTTIDEASSEAERFLTIDNQTVEQYKERLLNEAKLSPLSINRKLSSLRRYMRWLTEKGLLAIEVQKIEEKPVEEEAVIPTPAPKPVIVPEPIIPLTALKNMHSEEVALPKENKNYSAFAPIRLAQKISKGLALGLNAAIITPLADSYESLQYAVWKRSGKQVFAPVKTFLDVTADIPTPEEAIASTAAPIAASTLTSLSAKTASMVSNTTSKFTSFVRVKATVKPYAVRNISKSFYAPLHISLKEFTWWQKLIYHLRYTRPVWYKRYHSYPIAHHIHFAILIFATAVAGFATYQVATDDPRSQVVIAQTAAAPPRTLSFQGRLLDKTNTPITAETNLRFGVYNSASATGSAMLWQEVQSVTPNNDGYFSAVLGKKATLSQKLFNDNPNLYVGITVGKDNELQPRQQFPTAGYAANAKTLEGLKPITDTKDTANVVLALDSAGDLTIGGNASPTFQATGGQFTLSGQSLMLTTNPGSNGNVQISPDGTGIIDLLRPIQNTSNRVNESGVAGAVEVADLFAVVGQSASQSALTVKQNSTGDIISGFSGGTAKFRVNATGQGTFAGNLAVNGNTITTNSTSFGIANTSVINLSIGTSARAIFLGAQTGVTTINHDLAVKGNTTFNGSVTYDKVINANGGVNIPQGKSLTIADFTPGAIPFINASNELTQDAANFSWSQGSKALNIIDSLCLRSTSGACAGSAAGTIYASNATVQAADLAENYTSSQLLEPGDVVIPEGIDNNTAVVKATAEYQPQVIGIVSTKPGFTLNSDVQPDAAHPNIYPLALQGRVPVKVTTMNGEIKAGDPLTSSNIPGVAMKATKPGQIIAKALESYTNSDPLSVGKVMAFVNISYQAPQSSLTASGDLTLAKAANITTTGQDDITASNNNTTGQEEAKFGTLTADILNITSTIVIQGQQLNDYITGVVQRIIDPNYIANNKANTDVNSNLQNQASASASLTSNNQSATAAATINPIATASGDIVPTIASQSAPYTINNTATSAGAQNIASNEAQTATNAAFTHPEGMSDEEYKSFLDNNLKNNFMNIATLSGQLATVPNLQGEFATFTEGLISLGPTSLTDVGVSNLLSVGNNLQLTSDSINTIASDLNIQPLRQGNVVFMGGLVAIDTTGKLTVGGNADFAQDVTVRGKLSANIIAPIPGSDITVKLEDESTNPNSSFAIKDGAGQNVVKVNKKGDVAASGSGSFANINIVRGVQADTSATETHAQGSAGNGVIASRNTSRTIYTPYVSANSLIYVTATSDTQNASLYVARQTPQDAEGGSKGSFTVQIPNNVSRDITFNWWIVN